MMKWALLFIILFSVFLHWHKRKHDSSYPKVIFLGHSFGSGRSYDLDYLRLLATVMVIAVHTLSKASGGLAQDSFSWRFMTCTSTLLLTCNLLFVMVSGALILNGKEEKLSLFYCRRAAKIALPLFAYYCFYLLIHGGVSNFYPKNLWTTTKMMLSGAPDGAPHFWLIYVILSLYIWAPFIRIMVGHMSDKMILSLLFLIFLWSFFAAYLPILHISLGFEHIFTAWSMVFMLGFILTKNCTRKYDSAMLICGGLSFVITILCILFYPDYKDYLYNVSPTMMCMASAIFVKVRRMRNQLRKPWPIMASVNHYSYSILLIHWYILYYITGNIITLDGTMPAWGWQCVAAVGLTLVISYLFALVFDNTIVLCLEYIFKKITEALSRILALRLKNGQ